MARTNERSAYRALVGKPDGRRQLGGRRHRREDNIKIVLQEVGRGDVDLTVLALSSDRWEEIVNAVMNCRVSVSGIL